jgi:hypothetical protein
MFSACRPTADLRHGISKALRTANGNGFLDFGTPDAESSEQTVRLAC